VRNLLACCFIFFFAAAQAQIIPPPVAVLDLKDWKPEEKPVVPLDAPWEFYWDQLLGPQDFHRPPDLLLRPSSWNGLEVNGQKLGSYGYATYRIRLSNLPPRELLLDVYSVQTSCRIFVDGKLALEIGQPGTSKETTQPMTRDAQVRIPGGAGDVDIVVQIANFHHRKGGFVHPFELGTAEAVGAQRRMYYILQCVESSALAILGLFLLAMFIFRKKDLSVLYFSLFCITLSFRPITAVNYLLATLFPGMSWPLLLKIEYLAVLFPCLFMLLFIKRLFPEQLPNIIVKIIGGILIVKIFLTLFFPPAVFSWLVLPLLFVIFFGVIIFAFSIVRAMIAGVEGARYAGTGLIILLVSLLLKVLVYAGLIVPVHVLITALDIAFIFTMSLILGAHFSLQFIKVETLQRKTEALNEEVAKEKKQVEHQKEILEEKNREILDSITYAKRIQHAILPPMQLVKKHLPEAFIFYRPKDIVAGDFYWLETAHNANGSPLVLFGACDCTGHGVPGAMVSVVCYNALNRSVREFGLLRPHAILDKTRALVIEQFEKSEEEVQDGMDVALCALDPQTRMLHFAGANNSLLLIRNNELIIYKADKQPVAKYALDKPFTHQEVQLEKGDMIYIFSDGFADQFGGSKGKKFTSSGFKDLLMRIHKLSLEEQEREMDRVFESWKQGLEQVDDVMVIGLKF